MKSIGIIQPGRIGDIIISLPIAKYYNDKGYKIIWPIAAPFIKQFSDAVDYAQFIPVRHLNISDTQSWHRDAKWILNSFDCDKQFDLLLNMADADEASNKWRKSGKPFDEFRYDITNVPFEEKWNLQINRNEERENALYNKVVTQDKYVVCHTQASNVSRNITLSDEITNNYQVVNLTQITNNIFDWIKVLENATKLIMIDSCFANLVEQLDLNDNKTILDKGNDFQLPTLKTKWGR
tara:strand:- start:4059 stop:4769 length:711 start_codon:yes stop_codon:yes gene_type:complete